MLWLAYFRKIDMLEAERTIDICIAFSIGYLTPTLALWIYSGLNSVGFNFDGEFVNDFLYSIFGIGVTEELVKLFGVCIAFILLKKRISEPIDYLLFAGIVALGFSIRENFIYYNNYGSQTITGRTIIACLAHIINTSICVYGLYRYKIFNKGNVYINSIVGISVAIASHGLFDFFLTQEFIGILTPFLATVVYLIGINFWIQMFNNTINYSPYFNYQKIASTTALYKTILFWYASLLVLEFIYAFYYIDFLFAVKSVLNNLFKEGLLVLIVSVRISRLKISKRKYFPIKLQLPFYYTQNDDEDFKFLWIPIKIRGESEKEFQFLKYMGSTILIYPVNKEKSVIQHKKEARLLKKYYLKNDVVTYLLEVWNEDDHMKEIFLLKPKTRGITYIYKEYPIGILMYYENPALFQKEHETLAYSDLKIIEEVYLKQKY